MSGLAGTKGLWVHLVLVITLTPALSPTLDSQETTEAEATPAPSTAGEPDFPGAHLVREALRKPLSDDPESLLEYAELLAQGLRWEWALPLVERGLGRGYQDIDKLKEALSLKAGLVLELHGPEALDGFVASVKEIYGSDPRRTRLGLPLGASLQGMALGMKANRALINGDLLAAAQRMRDVNVAIEPFLAGEPPAAAYGTAFADLMTTASFEALAKDCDRAAQTLQRCEALLKAHPEIREQFGTEAMTKWETYVRLGQRSCAGAQVSPGSPAEAWREVRLPHYMLNYCSGQGAIGQLARLRYLDKILAYARKRPGAVRATDVVAGSGDPVASFEAIVEETLMRARLYANIRFTVHLRAGQLEKAAELCEEYVRLGQDRGCMGMTRLDLARAYAALGRKEEAVDQLRIAQDLFGRLSEHDQEFYAEVIASVEAQLTGAAPPVIFPGEHLVRRAVGHELQTDDPHELLKYARILSGRFMRWEDALGLLDSALRIGSEDAEQLFWMLALKAQLLAETESEDAAEAFLARAKQAYAGDRPDVGAFGLPLPASVEAYVKLILAGRALTAGEPANAAEYMRQLAAVFQPYLARADNPAPMAFAALRAMVKTAEAEAMAGQYDLARATYERAAAFLAAHPEIEAPTTWVRELEAGRQACAGQRVAAGSPEEAWREVDLRLHNYEVFQGGGALASMARVRFLEQALAYIEQHPGLAQSMETGKSYEAVAIELRELIADGLKQATSQAHARWERYFEQHVYDQAASLAEEYVRLGEDQGPLGMIRMDLARAYAALGRTDDATEELGRTKELLQALDAEAQAAYADRLRQAEEEVARARETG